MNNFAIQTDDLRFKETSEYENLTDIEFFYRRLNLIPEATRKKLREGDLQVCPYNFYSVKDCSKMSSLNIFDTKEAELGITNVAVGRIPPDTFFLLRKIRLTTFEKNPATANLVAQQSIDCDDNTEFGEWNFGQEGTTYVENCPLSMFDLGHLTITKMFYPQRSIKLRLEFPKPLPQGLWIKGELIGVRTMKA